MIEVRGDASQVQLHTERVPQHRDIDEMLVSAIQRQVGRPVLILPGKRDRTIPIINPHFPGQAEEVRPQDRIKTQVRSLHGTIRKYGEQQVPDEQVPNG